MAVVRPEERTAALGITGLVGLLGWAVAPLLAGAAMDRVSLATSLVAGAALNIGYDLAPYVSLRALRPPEETEATPS